MEEGGLGGWSVSSFLRLGRWKRRGERRWLLQPCLERGPPWAQDDGPQGRSDFGVLASPGVGKGEPRLFCCCPGGGGDGGPERPESDRAKQPRGRVPSKARGPRTAREGVHLLMGEASGGECWAGAPNCPSSQAGTWTKAKRGTVRASSWQPSCAGDGARERHPGRRAQVHPSLQAQRNSRTQALRASRPGLTRRLIYAAGYRRKGEAEGMRG